MRARSPITSVAAVALLAALTPLAPAAAAPSSAAAQDGAPVPAGAELAPAGATPSAGDVVAVVETADGDLEVVSYDVAPGTATDDVVEALASSPDVVAVEADHAWSIDDDAPADPRSSGTDPGRSAQWHLDAVGAPQLWGRGGDAAIVAVLDTGVDADHPDLAGLVLPGWDFTSDAPSTTDRGYHGTFVTSMITAHRGNGVGVAPTVEDLRILPATVCAPSCYMSDIAAAILWATDQGADVINMSLGGTTGSPAVQAAVDDARAQGVLVVASAGNSGDDGNPPNFPAAHDGVIGVGAVAPGDAVTTWASYGDWVDVAAPGQAVAGLVPDETATYTASGTSFSAPIVSAALALVRSSAPDLTVAGIEALLLDTVRDVHAPGRDDRTGEGTLDLVALVEAVDLLTTPPPPPPPPAGFDDVPTGAFYSTPVDWARAEGLTTGVGGRNVFLPEREITRGEAMTLLWRIAGQPAAPASAFDDVPTTAFYAPAVGWARQQAFTTGVGGRNVFEPGRNISRAELVTLMWRVAGQPSAPASGFDDVPTTAFYAPALGWARQRGLTTGVAGQNVFQPLRPITRAEAFTLQYRARPGG